MKITMELVIFSCIMLISAAVEEHVMPNELAPVTGKNNLSNSTASLFGVKKIETVIKKKLTNPKHEITTVFMSTENVENFTDYSMKEETTTHLTKKSVPYTKPKSVSEEATQWVFDWPNGESMTVKFSVQINGTYLRTDKLREFYTINLPAKTYKGTYFEKNLKMVEIKWLGKGFAEVNSIFMKFIRSDSGAYCLDTLLITVPLTLAKLKELELKQYNQQIITECKGVNKTCSYDIYIKEHNILKDYESSHDFVMNNLEFSITDNTDESF